MLEFVHFILGVTAEEFVTRPKIGPKPSDYGNSQYDMLRTRLAKKLGVPTVNVDIFTVRNHPSLPSTIDVRFAAHGSPHYRPEKLNGAVLENQDEVMATKTTLYMYKIGVSQMRF